MYIHIYMLKMCIHNCYPPAPATARPGSVPAGNAQRSLLGFQPEGLLHHLLPRSYIGDEGVEPARRKGGAQVVTDTVGEALRFVSKCSPIVDLVLSDTDTESCVETCREAQR